jgi:hypothetical protein
MISVGIDRLFDLCEIRVPPRPYRTLPMMPPRFMVA